MKKFLLLIIIITIIPLFFLFHDRGNELLKPYLSSYLESKIKEDVEIDIQKLKIDIGNIEARVLINKNIILKSDVNFSIIDTNTLNLQGVINSNLANLSFKNAIYTLKNRQLRSDYHLEIKELKSLQPIIKHKLYGSLVVDGKIKKDKEIYLRGVTKSLDGVLDFTLKNDNLTSNIHNLSVVKVMKMLDYPTTFRGNLFGDVHYNIKNKKGKIDTELKQAQLLPNEITKMVKRLRGVDLTKERYNDSRFKADINHEIINFDFIAKSRTTDILLQNAHLNIDKESIETNYTLSIDNKDISGTLKGDINNPKMTIDSSKFMENKINQTLENFGIGKKEKGMIKDIFNGFFSK